MLTEIICAYAADFGKRCNAPQEGNRVSMYGKLFESMFTGSMVGIGAIRFAVWSYVVAHTKPDSMVEINPKILAVILGEKVEDVEATIEFFCSPDPGSRSKEQEGRRLLKEGEFLYFVVNAGKYQTIRDEERRRHQNREAQARFREKGKNGVAGEVTVTGSNEMKQKVTNPTASASVQGEVLGEKKTKARSHVMTQSRIVLAYLNEKAGRHYREVAVNLTRIAARLEEVGGDLEGVKRMIDRQCVRWKGDEKMDEYLRPQTLFTRENFAGYYDNRDVPVAGQVEKKTWQDKDVEKTTAGAMQTLKNLKL